MSKRELPSKQTEQQVQQVEFDRSPNTQWHVKHQLPNNPTLEQRVQWHMEHARRCPCPSQDEDILEELKKRYLGKHQDFWIFYNRNDHRALGLWAAYCAEHLLPYFEEKYPEDTRPRDAISTLRAWVQTGEFRMAVILHYSQKRHVLAGWPEGYYVGREVQLSQSPVHRGLPGRPALSPLRRHGH